MMNWFRMMYENMWRCPKCKAWNPDSSDKCLNCES